MVTIKSVNFNNIKVKLETSSSQKITILEYEVDIGFGGKQMPVNMFKIVFPKTLMREPANYENKKTVLCAYNDSCIPQLGICKGNHYA